MSRGTAPDSAGAGSFLAYLDARGDWIAAVAGALLAAAFAPVGAWPLAIACPALLMLTWRTATPRIAARRGFLFTAATFLAGTYWLYHSIHLIGQAPVWIALFLMFGMVSVMGAYTALLGWALVRYGPPAGPLRHLVVAPAGLVLIEWLRGWLFSGFPWLALGYTQLDTGLAAWAPVGGVYAVGLAVAVLAGALATLLAGGRVARAIAAATVIALCVGSYLLGAIEWTRPLPRTVTVALVQGAVPQTMKWAPGQLERTMELYRDLTRPYLGADIIVWPESAIPSLESNVRGYIDAVSQTANASGSALITGLVRREPGSGNYYNSIAAWSPDEQWYYKRRLVPFGEFFPVPAAVREWMRLMNLPYSDFSAGSDEQRPLQAAGERLAPTICYEDAYGTEQRPLARAATLLVNVTNDAWFGDSSAPHQHLDISRMRSLETGRPMLRATNDGVTALIAHDGSVMAALPQFRPAVLTGRVTPREGETPYLRYGNLPVLVLAFLALGAGVLARRRAAR